MQWTAEQAAAQQAEACNSHGEKIITLEPLRRLFINEQDSTGDSTEITPTLNQIKYITVTDNLHVKNYIRC